jgi:hypothetical protein
VDHAERERHAPPKPASAEKRPSAYTLKQRWNGSPSAPRWKLRGHSAHGSSFRGERSANPESRPAAQNCIPGSAFGRSGMTILPDRKMR